MTPLLSNWTLQKAFVWTLSAKILSATLAVLLNSTWFFGFFLPLSFMLVYMWYGNKKTKDSGHSMRQSYGDSCYYLGFLFTVASLIAALFVLGLHDNLETAELAIRFAAAMVTTHARHVCARLYGDLRQKRRRFANGSYWHCSSTDFARRQL